MNKIKNRSDFAKKLPSVYRWLCINKKLDLLQSLGDPLHNINGYWTFENCLKEFKKYGNVSEWRKNSGSSYVIAKNNGWNKIIQERFNLPTRHLWKKDDCRKYALRYTTREGWKKGHRKSWESAHNNEWIDELTKHMPKNACIKYVKNLCTLKVYNSIAEAGRCLNICQSNISACCSGRQKSAGGYYWAHCDKDGNIIK